jgi:hypothetical protein
MRCMSGPSDRFERFSVIPAKAGIQSDSELDSRVRGNDGVVGSVQPDEA